MTKKSATIKIYGKVQGVFFRANAVQNARLFSLSGYVKNCDDGTVEIVAEGEESDINRLIEWCRKGPSRADVLTLNTEWGEFQGKYTEFKVLKEE